MCTGMEIVALIGTAASVASSTGLIGGTKPTPQAVQTPVDDTEVKASQDAAAKKLAQRRAARANSLLSSAGAAGDTSDPLSASAGAYGKTSLGA